LSYLAEKYKELCNDSALDINEHLPTFVDAVEELNATRILELGVRYGVSTIAWLHALEERGKGHLWAVDCSFPFEAGNPTNLLDPQAPGGLGVQTNWNFILGDYHTSEVQELLPKKVDIWFLDGNHVYEETLVELDLYYPRVRKGGRIFLHDTAIETTGNATTPQPPFPVRTAMEEWCEKNDLKFTNVENCCGLGTIYC